MKRMHKHDVRRMRKTQMMKENEERGSRWKTRSFSKRKESKRGETQKYFCRLRGEQATRKVF